MVKLTIIFPSDPFGKKIGGGETYINDIVKFAPKDFEIEFIGITTDKKERPLRKWSLCRLGKKDFKFYALSFDRNENKKTFIPLSLNFTLRLALSGINLVDRVLFLNRIEPALAFLHNRSPKIGVIHNDIRQQIKKRGSEVLWGKLPWLYFKTEDIIFKSLDHIYSESMGAIEFYHLRYPQQKEKFSFLPTWSDVDTFFPASEPKSVLRQAPYFLERYLPPYKKWVLFVGRLQQQKAPMRLLDAFFEYRLKNKESCLIIVGDGNLRGEVERYIKKLALEKDVFLIGQVGKKELVNFYRASDCLLLASNFEGMPLAVLEALGCGLPAVSTNAGEVERVIKSGYSGEVIKSFDPKDLAQGLEKVLNKPEIYAINNCINAVKEYAPQNVLKPAYEMIRKLYKETFTTYK